MKTASTLSALGLVLMLPACGGEEIIDALGQLPPPGSGGGTPEQRGPNYAVNGFSVGKNEALAIVTVIETDKNTRLKNYNAGTPSDLRIVFDASRGTLALFSEGKAFDGTVDPEGVTLTATGRSNQVFRNLVSGNDATLEVGEYAWRLSARYDQDDGRFRHNLVATGGQIFLPLPVSGEGNYDAVMRGVIEQVDSTGSWKQIPYLARGKVTVAFDGGAVTSDFKLDPAFNNATGNILAGGTLVSGGNFEGSSNGVVVLDGRSAAVRGTMTGFVAGPNGEEVAGVKYLNGISPSLVSTTMDGAFLGRDPSR